jgi:hypothetical protein
MKITSRFAEGVIRDKRNTSTAILFSCLLVSVVSGCAVFRNSASFYQDIPRRPINWREYTSD